MLKVDSKKTIRAVTGSFLRVNRGRNRILILAIVMMSALFTALFTASASVIKSRQQQEMRQTMSASHIDIQDLTEEQFEKIKDDPLISRYGYTIFMGLAENPELATSQTELRYADANGAEAYMSLPAKGHLPESYAEIAMSTITMELLGIPKELGAPVTLTFTLNGQQMTQEFYLSGYWKGDPLFMAQEVWISQAFCEAHVKKATVESLEQGDFEGGYNLSIWCDSIWGLEKKAETLGLRYEIQNTAGSISANPAMLLFEEDAFPFGTMAVVLLLIFLSGYLIIYNVFQISVFHDLQVYGLLKNIGATGRQLKKMVLRQALLLSAVGIPLGLLCGYGIGSAMTPYLLSDASGYQTETVLTMNPLVFAGSALFALLTVYIGCMRPCSMVAELSPVEAVRMTEGAQGKEPAKKRRMGKITPFSMALENIKRSWKKAVLVILSLALPLVILNAVWTVATGFHFENFLDAYCTWDFDISGLTANRSSSNLHAVTPETKKALEENPDAVSVGLVYDWEFSHTLSDTGYENLSHILANAEKDGYLKGYSLEEERTYLENREVIAHLLGMNPAAFEKLTFVEGKADYENFASGDYVLVGNLYQDYGQYYAPGDQITLPAQDGTEKTYTVLGIVEIPYDMGYRFGASVYFDYTFVLPEEEYQRATGDENAMLAGVDVKEGTEKSFDRWLTSFQEQAENSLYTESRMSVLEECQGFARKYSVTMGLLCLVLFVIGILNFFNTSYVNILSRRRELSLLEAVGMTGKQLRRMLIAEGLLYLSAATLLADTIGMLLAKPLIERTVGQTFFFSCQMTILPSILIFPLLAAVAAAVPVYNFRHMQRESVVERLR